MFWYFLMGLHMILQIIPFTKACFNAFKTQLSKHYKQVNLKRDRTRMAMIRLEADMPGSSMGKCLKNQFTGYEDADPWGDGED